MRPDVMVRLALNRQSILLVPLTQPPPVIYLLPPSP